MRNVSAPFGVSEAGKPNISATIFCTVADLTNGIYYYDSTLSPNIVWLDQRKLNLAVGAPVEELELISNPGLVGDVTAGFNPTTPFKFMPAGEHGVEVSRTSPGGLDPRVASRGAERTCGVAQVALPVKLSDRAGRRPANRP